VKKIDKNFKGIINLYKPVGPSSFAMVRKLRNVLDEKKIGHAGTLDPLASGVLVVAVGKEFTKKISEIQKLKKTYSATFYLGKISTTDDEEGSKEDAEVSGKPDIDKVNKCLESFLGKQLQVPPRYSAKKISGKRAYALARQGKEFNLKPKLINIYKIDIVEYSWPFLKIEVCCSTGTYIRSLARDIGECLGTGAYLKSLIRVAVGKYKIDDSIKIN
jgi:tRNA pseudouridine55 synthase